MMPEGLAGLVFESYEAPLTYTPAWTTGPHQAALTRGAPLSERRVLLLEARHGTQRPL